MHRFLSSICGLALFLFLVSCAASTPGGIPCENCRYSYRRVSRRHTETMMTCVIEGKVVDCKRDPAECPECAKRMQERKQD